MNKDLITICSLASVLLLAQCSSEAPPAAGTLRLNDPVAQEYMSKAKEAESRSKWSRALDNYQKVVKKAPLSQEAPSARFRMAQLDMQQGDFTEAFDDYQKVIEQYPESPLYTPALKAQRDLAFRAAKGELTNKVLWLFSVNMDPSVVNRWLQTVCDNAPYSDSAPEAMNIWGKYLSDRDRNKEAIDVYQKLVDSYPTSPYAPGAQLAIAKIYHGAEGEGDRNNANVMRAQEAYEDFLQRYPNHPQSGEARKGLTEIRRSLVRQKLEIGDYYLNRMKDRSAAVFSYQEVAAEGATDPESAAKAKAKLKALGVPEK
jgi:outer membrane protein assembly factor BamD